MEGRIANAIGGKMDDVVQNMHESNQQVIEQLDNLNDSIRKSYASQQGNQVQRSQSPQQRSQSRPQRQANNQGGMNPQQMDSQTQGSENDFSNDDRMKRLREKFGNVQEE